MVAAADVVDTLKELIGQAAAAHAYEAGQGLTLTVETPGPVTVPVLSDAQHYDLMVGAGDPIRLVGWGRTIAGLVSGSPRLAVPRAARGAARRSRDRRRRLATWTSCSTSSCRSPSGSARPR